MMRISIGNLNTEQRQAAETLLRKMQEKRKVNVVKKVAKFILLFGLLVGASFVFWGMFLQRSFHAWVLLGVFWFALYLEWRKK